ncbi:MAG: histidinol-phosphatase [Clostridia bacterium]|nr:histidinol-phosphatase [Clostridia bacterium]
MKFSFHNHTYRCGHAQGTEEQFVLEAIKAGYETFGFADHAPHCYPETHTVVGRMNIEEGLTEYCETILALRHKYRDYIDIKLGLETEYFPAYHEKTMQKYRANGIEYILLGQHMTGNEGLPGAYFCFQPTEDAAGLTKYVDQCIEGMATGQFSYVAHPEVFNYVGEDDDFRRAEYDRLIAKAKEMDLPLEINLLGLGGNRHYPSPIFWERAALANVKAVIGCDAHDPSQVHHAANVEKGFRFAEKYKLSLVEDIKLIRP